MKVLCQVEYCFYNKNNNLIELDEFEVNDEATHVRLVLYSVKKEIHTDYKDNVSEAYRKKDFIKDTILFNIKESENKTILLTFDDFVWSHQITKERRYDIFISNGPIEI